MFGTFQAPAAVPGKPISEAYAALRKEEAAYALLRHGRHRQWRTPHGVTQTVDVPAAVFLHPWRSVLGPDNTVLIRPGRIKLVMPRIDGVTLDGKTADGLDVGAPYFQLPKDAKPNAELESFICAQVEIDLKTGKLLVAKTPSVTIVHVTSPDVTHRDGGTLARNQFGIKPIACLVWSDEKTIGRIEQIAMFDYTHEFCPSGTGARGRHFFSPE